MLLELNVPFVYTMHGANAKQIHMIRTFLDIHTNTVELVQMAYHIIYGFSDCFVEFFERERKKGEMFHLNAFAKIFSHFGIWLFSQRKLCNSTVSKTFETLKKNKTFDSLINFLSKCSNKSAQFVFDFNFFSPFFLTLQLKSKNNRNKSNKYVQRFVFRFYWFYTILFCSRVWWIIVVYRLCIDMNRCSKCF